MKRHLLCMTLALLLLLTAVLSACKGDPAPSPAPSVPTSPSVSVTVPEEPTATPSSGGTTAPSPGVTPTVSPSPGVTPPSDSVTTDFNRENAAIIAVRADEAAQKIGSYISKGKIENRMQDPSVIYRYLLEVNGDTGTVKFMLTTWDEEALFTAYRTEKGFFATKDGETFVSLSEMLDEYGLAAVGALLENLDEADALSALTDFMQANAMDAVAKKTDTGYLFQHRKDLAGMANALFGSVDALLSYSGKDALNLLLSYTAPKMDADTVAVLVKNVLSGMTVKTVYETVADETVKTVLPAVYEALTGKPFTEFLTTYGEKTIAEVFYPSLDKQEAKAAFAAAVDKAMQASLSETLAELLTEEKYNQLISFVRTTTLTFLGVAADFTLDNQVRITYAVFPVGVVGKTDNAVFDRDVTLTFNFTYETPEIELPAGLK